MKRLLYLLIVLLTITAGCGQGTVKVKESEGKNAVKNFVLSEVWKSDTLLRTPESAIYDSERDILYVTNVNLEPRLKDGNGFISKVNTDGKITELKWVEGLNAPKGTAIVADTLYVADIDELVLIDIIKGDIIRKVTIAGIGMINDITSDDDGNLFISDTDSNKIYRYSGGRMSVWLDKGLDRPNGLLAEKERVLLASMGSMDFVSLDIDSGTKKIIATGINRGDGIAFTGIQGCYLLSDWSGEIFMINEETGKISLLKTIDQHINTADICYIPGKNLLIVPTFSKNFLWAFNLEEK